MENGKWKMENKIWIREAELADVPAIVELSHAHALYECASYDKRGTAELLSTHLFAKDSPTKILLVQAGRESVGYASVMKQFSTWDAAYYLYLDCLFLIETYRGKGLGRVMMNAIKEEAKAQGCTTIQWQTPDFNIDAIQFYQKIGAAAKSKERFFWELA